MNMMNDQQVRRFINNLCNYTEGKEVELPTELEKALWVGVLPSLKINDAKYERVLERNRKNGQMGGAPLGNQNARKDETTQNNPNNPISDKREVVNDKREMISDNREVVSENSEEINEDWQVKNNDSISIENECSIFSLNEIENPDDIPVTVIDAIGDPTNPESNSITSNNSINEFREIMNDFFVDYANWEADLYKLGFEKFIKSTSFYHSNNADYIAMIRDFYEM